jgi:hypothetical protein
MKKIILSLLGIAVVLALSAQVSWAWEYSLSGSQVCNAATGNYDITWVADNTTNKTEDFTVTSSNRAVVSVGDVVTKGTTRDFTENLPGTTSAPVTLDIAGGWPSDPGPHQNEATVTLEGTCLPPNPTPTPTQEVTPTPTATPSNPGGGSTNPPSCGDQKPNQPYNILAVAGPGTGQVTLTWGPPSGPVSDYSITYSDDPSTQKWGVISTGNVTKYTISGLAVNKYYFWVNSINGCMPGSPVGPVVVGGTGGPIQAVLGLSTTSGEESFLPQLIQLFGSLTSAGLGLIFFKKNG